MARFCFILCVTSLAMAMSQDSAEPSPKGFESAGRTFLDLEKAPAQKAKETVAKKAPAEKLKKGAAEKAPAEKPKQTMKAPAEKPKQTMKAPAEKPKKAAAQKAPAEKPKKAAAEKTPADKPKKVAAKKPTANAIPDKAEQAAISKNRPQRKAARHTVATE